MMEPSLRGEKPVLFFDPILRKSVVQPHALIGKDERGRQAEHYCENQQSYPHLWLFSILCPRCGGPDARVMFTGDGYLDILRGVDFRAKRGVFGPTWFAATGATSPKVHGLKSFDWPFIVVILS